MVTTVAMVAPATAVVVVVPAPGSAGETKMVGEVATVGEMEMAGVASASGSAEEELHPRLPSATE